jgi:hypothetical protein
VNIISRDRIGLCIAMRILPQLETEAMEDPGSNQLSGSRRVITTCGYAMLCLSVLLHIAMWVRAEQLLGF